MTDDLNDLDARIAKFKQCSVDVRTDTGTAHSSGSQYVRDADGIVTPTIQLGSEMKDQLTVVHETAHMLLGPNSHNDVGHGGSFQQTYQTLLDRELPEQGRAFREESAKKK